jgi:hypothetical protein
MDEGKVTDGFTTLAGGMHLAGDNPHVTGADQAEVLVNATVRHGWAEPRPRFRQLQILWTHRLAQQSFEGGIIQGSARYESNEGPRIVFAADGRLISFNPDTREAHLLTPDGVTRPFLQNIPFIHLQQRGKWLIAQDGLNPPVIVEGDNARFDRDPFSGIPVGAMMADGWHRLIVVAPDRERIFLSDHELDPSTTPLSFTDGAEYYLNARYFRVPRELGKIVSVAFAPSFNFQDDLGPLVVFCERGTRTYSIQYPREEWIQRDISSTMLPTIGACAHGAVVSRGNDMIFSDHNGRIQTFKAAISRRESVRIGHIDQPVHELYERENAALRRWRRAERFDDRILTTVWPERVRRPGGFSVRHRGFVVMEEDFLSDRPFVWAGLWTGVYPVAINVVGHQKSPNHSPEERCFVTSLDDDGINRIYELDREAGPDLMPAPRRVPMWVVPRWMDWKSVFDQKRYLSASVQLGPIRGRVTVKGMWQTSDRRAQQWFTHEDAGPKCFQLCPGIKPLFAPGRPRLNLPAIPTKDAFFRARPILQVLGQTSIREVAFHTEMLSASHSNDTRCQPPVEVVTSEDCGLNFWRHEGDDPVMPPVQICNPTNQ